MEINGHMFGACMEDWIDRPVSGTNVVAPMLSHQRFGGVESVTPSSLRREQIQSKSAAVLAIDLYSAFVEDRETIGCFLLQEIKFLPRKHNKLL